MLIPKNTYKFVPGGNLMSTTMPITTTLPKVGVTSSYLGTIGQYTLDGLSKIKAVAFAVFAKIAEFAVAAGKIIASLASRSCSAISYYGSIALRSTGNGVATAAKFVATKASKGFVFAKDTIAANPTNAVIASGLTLAAAAIVYIAANHFHTPAPVAGTVATA
jgi:hypothetical protein